MTDRVAPESSQGIEEPLRSVTRRAAGEGASRDLFGRGMLFVVVWSLQMITATVVSPVLAWMLAPAEFGALAAAIALYQFLTIAGVLGLDQALEMQRLEDDDDRRARGLLGAGIGYALVLTVLASVTSPAWSPFLGFRDGGGLVVVALAWTFPGISVLLVLALLQAEDRLRRFTVVSVVSTVGSQLLGLLLLTTGPRTAVTYALGGVIGQTIAFVLAMVWGRPRLRGLWDWGPLRTGLALGIPLALASLCQFVLNAGDRFFVQRCLGEAETGRYQVAFVVGSVLTILLTFVNRAWLPRLKAITDEIVRWTVIRDSRDEVYCLLALALLGLTVAAPVVLRIVAPASYRLDTLTPVVFVVALAALPVAAAGASGRMLITLADSRPLGWAALVAVVVKVGITAAFVPAFGLTGAALGTLCGVAAQAVCQRWFLTRRISYGTSSDSSLMLVSLAVLLAAASLWLPQTPVWNIGRFTVASLLVPVFFLRFRRLVRQD